jgi:protein-disulfide isomerase
MALTSLLLAACAGTQPQSQPGSPSAPATGAEPAPVAVVVPSEPEAQEPALATVRVDEPADGAVMVGAGGADDSIFAISPNDPALGRPDALVTLVVFGDIQCPFTSRLFGTLENLRRQYGDGELRIVWKHLPLPFHKEAAPAAEASVAVHRLGGSRAFYCFLGELFDKQRSLDATVYQQAAQKCGVNPAAMEAEVRSGNPARKVAADQQIAQATGTRGTPNSFINGFQLSGAQPVDKFISALDAEKAEARKAIASGVSPLELHASRAKENFSKPAPRPARPSAAAMPNTTVYKVPVGQSPVLGSQYALVTIVMFQDFQCPFCRRSASTIAQLRTEFGNDLRVVFKHNPLPFHKEAMPAAQLAMEARAQKGNTGFWQAYDALFAETRIDDAILDQVARNLRLNAHAVRSAITSNRHQTAIDADVQLARQLGATGTPTFYINGRRLTGAQPIEKFRALINEVLPTAKALTQRGVPRARVYAETIKNGVTGPNKP